MLVVGNNWAGTADVVDPHTFERLTRLNIVPDLGARKAEILANPLAAGLFKAKRLLVSASTARNAHVIDAATGAIVGSFASGDSPHESNFSADGSLIYHASIGLVDTPADAPELDASKGDRYFEIVGARTLEVRTRLDIGKLLAAAGHPGYSSAVRPALRTVERELAAGWRRVRLGGHRRGGQPVCLRVVRFLVR